MQSPKNPFWTSLALTCHEGNDRLYALLALYFRIFIMVFSERVPVPALRYPFLKSHLPALREDEKVQNN